MENINVFRPMLYSTPMVQGLLNGTKTNTRRLQGLESLNESNEMYDWQFVTMYSNDDEKSVVGFKARNGFSDTWKEVYKKINIGDIIWVRETFMEAPNFPLIPEKYYYKASVSEQFLKEWKGHWTPSLFMTKDACRLWLKVTNVRVEKLNDITEEDAVREGVDNWTWKNMAKPQNWKNYLEPNSPPLCSAYDSYFTLWESINGEGSWDENPFVWVYDFEVIREAPLGFR